LTRKSKNYRYARLVVYIFSDPSWKVLFFLVEISQLFSILL